MMAVEIIKAVEICRGAGLDSALLLYFLQSTRFCESEPLSFVVDKTSIMKELISKAVKQAIDECFAEDIMTDFFKEHRQEVIDMSITEYLSEELAEVYKEDGFEEGRSVGHKEGREEGREEGRDTHLIMQVTKKLSKGCVPEEIANSLEEPLETVKEICEAATKYAPDYDVVKIFEELRRAKRPES